MQAPGGNSSISFGAQDVLPNVSSNAFAKGTNQNCGNAITGRSSTTVQQAPGGTSTLCLGTSPLEDGITYRPSTHVQNGPGGASTICIGDKGSVSVKVVSSNAFAHGSNPNCDNGITERPSTTVKQPPGGSSTVCLGGDFPDAPAVGVSVSKRALMGVSMRCPGGETTIDLGGERPYTPVDASSKYVQAPGGKSSLESGCAPSGTDSEQSHVRVSNAGASTLCLGDDSSSLIPAAARGPVGGETTIVLGTQDPKDMFEHASSCRGTAFDRPDAAVRFPQAPGGTASIVLGMDDSKKSFAERFAERNTVQTTPDAAPRFPQAPGGTSTIILGACEADDECVRPHGQPPGGASSMSSGCTFDPIDAQKSSQPRGYPGGASTVCLGHNEAAIGDVRVERGPVGGKSTIDLGHEDAAKTWAEDHERRCVAITTPDAAPRFSQPIGGGTTISFGTHDSKVVFNARQKERSAVLETPDAPPRFPQAPGGTSSFCFGLGGTDDARAESSCEARLARAPGGPSSLSSGCAPHGADEIQVPHKRVCAGGAATVYLGDEVLAYEVPAVRGPVGGAASISLGTDDTAKMFEEIRLRQAMATDTPDALARFPQPVGGTASIVLGTHRNTETFAERQAERGVVYETPSAATRFPQAPGGTATIRLENTMDVCVEMRVPRACLGGASTLTLGDSVHEVTVTTSRGPVGGEATIVLGTDDAKQIFEEDRLLRHTVMFTPEAARRFQQAPGGTASLCLGTSSGLQEADNFVPRGPVGGEATIVLGIDDVKQVFEEDRLIRQNVVPTPEAARRFQQAPGGAASICLGTASGAQDTDVAVCRGAVGGDATIVLGIDNAKQVFEEDRLLRHATVATPDAARRFPQAPGGTTSICLGTSEESFPVVSSNAFAKNSSQNSGNFIGRATTHVSHAPGGASTICLGGDFPEGPRVGLSVSKAARKGLQAPGGAATICLGVNDENINRINIVQVNDPTQKVLRPPSHDASADADVLIG